MGQSKSKDFNSIKERIQCRLESWQSQLLSKARKATLIKSIAQSIPTYSMSTFRFLKGFCEELDGIIRRF